MFCLDLVYNRETWKEIKGLIYIYIYFSFKDADDGVDEGELVAIVVWYINELARFCWGALSLFHSFYIYTKWQIQCLTTDLKCRLLVSWMTLKRWEEEV